MTTTTRPALWRAQHASTPAARLRWHLPIWIALGTLGAVGPQNFAFVQSLPLLLLGVVGGIGTAAGALVAVSALALGYGVRPATLPSSMVPPSLLGGFDAFGTERFAIVRVHQHGATLSRACGARGTGGGRELQDSRPGAA